MVFDSLMGFTGRQPQPVLLAIDGGFLTPGLNAPV